MKCYMICTIDYDVCTLYNGFIGNLFIDLFSSISVIYMLEPVRVCRYQRIYSSISTNNLSISTSSGRKLSSYIFLLRILYHCVSVDISESIHRYGQIIRWYWQILVWNSVLVCCWEGLIQFSSISIDILLISMNDDKKPSSYIYAALESLSMSICFLFLWIHWYWVKDHSILWFLYL